ncbi:hypothetical protein ABN028_19820 [Actinopolymorpha sp. B17G11]|uniref:hypothetical protein n=1 Tax=Actinopolymorpha sp. B17G11 TaxID=3160861 RepID=UPI0032E3D0A3
MSAKYVRDTYKVPARRGGRVRYTGDKDGPKLATIVSFPGPHLGLRFDGETRTISAHPTWEIEYLPPATREK